MRLEKIKLAGFKSFVDPTTVNIPSNLVCVVGPNGCGKSNIIDAVRWVMGESSAKMLRGESMADVIFNGSSTRKPIGSASIELLFDNSDGGAGGQYAKYNQISVKRQVHRDGQSSYIMNGVRCRRRDITDLFLGTGLGPRSYSIIEQGMISRLIEAKPEDLRAFLEEAAGISKYKERRRETENRIKRTRDNLSRLDDLREEVEKQLQRLKRQSATAERYKILKQQDRRMHAELLALRWQGMGAELQLGEKRLRDQTTVMEAALAKQRSLEARIEQEREEHTEANDGFNAVQGRFYAVGAEIARLEQTIKYSTEVRQQQELDLEQTQHSWQESTDHQQQDSERLKEINRVLEQDDPHLQEARKLERSAAEELSRAEQEVNSWQSEWDEFNRHAAEPAQVAQVERTRINQLEQQEKNHQMRLQRLESELERLLEPSLQQEILQFQEQEQRQQAQVGVLQGQLERSGVAISTAREKNSSLQAERNEVLAELQRLSGRQASLETLQEAALGKQGQESAQWLERHQLDKATRLAEKIEVEDGWQQAVETVLGFHLQAICADGLDGVADNLEALQNGLLTLFDTSAGTTAGNRDAGTLLHKVKVPWDLGSLMSGVRVADDLPQALAMRGALNPGESVITRSGIWVGSNWLRLNRETGETSGVLEREQEMRELAGKKEQLQTRVEGLNVAVQDVRDGLQQAEQARDQIQNQMNQVNRALSDIRSNLSGRVARAEQQKNRNANISREISELQEQQQREQEEVTQARTKLHAALSEMENLAGQREELIKRRDQLRSQRADTRDQALDLRSKAHEIALRIESMRSSQQSLQQNLERMKTQITHFSARRDELTSSIEESHVPLEQNNQNLEQQLQLRVGIESEMQAARKTLEQIETALRKHEQERGEAEQEVEKERTILDQGRLQHQEILVRYKTIDEQIDESGFARDDLTSNLPEDATIEQWEQELERMDMRIRRLGPINLAAIDEYQEQSERKQYLDSQHEDVTKSLETLENAIRKIDRETRTRFKETFDKVNAGLQEKFPRLFGGGHAYLQLTDDDLLDTGVTVMARPPGKRNSSIHLLSGGEKALTAVALVFAIFSLNPSPFCMLDEVDAPLDDANVSRYCELVKSMSDKVQFIFITHNKLTMEIAHHLTGVTMHEAGVSRLVSVDLDEAAMMVAK
ncbi:MAG: chromosome segregation protein SMC [Gammaproteobacteria bacterium]|nr:chromosome segregation protein SMC [Gammaproteobacteria bacterium]